MSFALFNSLFVFIDCFYSLVGIVCVVFVCILVRKKVFGKNVVGVSKSISVEVFGEMTDVVGVIAVFVVGIVVMVIAAFIVSGLIFFLVVRRVISRVEFCI